MMAPSKQPENLEYLLSRLPEMVSTLGRFVKAESPSLDKIAANRCAEMIAAAWRKTGARVERKSQKERGNHLCATYWASKGRAPGQLLILGHYDTVYSAGTLRKMPFRVSKGKAFGPGTFDMKGGIVQALFALEALQRTETKLQKRLVFLWTSDEEIGSDSSRKLIETEARKSDAVFVLEPAFGPAGLLKTERKAIGNLELVVHGRAAHAGLAPQEGVNAIHEMAEQIAQLQKWNQSVPGISIHACEVEGGDRSNVIPDRARALFDLRADRMTDMRVIEQRLRKLRPILPQAKLEVHASFDRPPLERRMSGALFLKAQQLASSMGLDIGECKVGGGSDGNITAAIGVPTLDGLGAVGDGAHSATEHVEIEQMPVRAALLAGLLASS